MIPSRIKELWLYPGCWRAMKTTPFGFWASLLWFLLSKEFKYVLCKLRREEIIFLG